MNKSHKKFNKSEKNGKKYWISQGILSEEKSGNPDKISDSTSRIDFKKKCDNNKINYQAL